MRDLTIKELLYNREYLDGYNTNKEKIYDFLEDTYNQAELETEKFTWKIKYAILDFVLFIKVKPPFQIKKLPNILVDVLDKYTTEDTLLSLSYFINKLYKEEYETVKQILGDKEVSRILNKYSIYETNEIIEELPYQEAKEQYPHLFEGEFIDDKDNILDRVDIVNILLEEVDYDYLLDMVIDYVIY